MAAYICTKFGVDSSSRFSFRMRTLRHAQSDRQTHKVTDATDHPVPRIGYRLLGMIIIIIIINIIVLIIMLVIDNCELQLHYCYTLLYHNTLTLCVWVCHTQ